MKYPRIFNLIILSGLILQELKHIPKAGEKIQWKRIQIEVIDMDGTKIDKLLVKRKIKAFPIYAIRIQLK